jgi:transcriptional regulator with XRE-family HTH domain
MPALSTKLKQLRTQKKLTQKELAQKVKCTPAYICQLESGKADPSISTLKKISTALGITIIDFFRTDYAEKVILKKKDREIFKFPKSKTTVETLIPNPGNKKMDARIAFIGPGGGSRGTYHHEGEEFGYVIQGELELRYAGETFVLSAGDSFYLKSHIEHEYLNKKDEEVIVLWVNHPPSF